MVPNCRKTVGFRSRGNSSGLLLLCCLLYIANCSEAKTIIERYARPSPDQYQQQRAQMVEAEANATLGSDIQLTAQETLVNYHLMMLKRQELTIGFKNPYEFTAARHFFEVLDKINASLLFQLIRRMPKGGVLHAHDTALASTEAIVNATYQEHLWQKGDFSSPEGPEFQFNRSSQDGWELVSKRRSKMGERQYNDKIRQLFSLYDKDPTTAYRTINDVWNKFSKLFLRLAPIVTYRPVWESYFRAALQEFYDDNVMYLEFRGLLPQLYDLDGKTYTPEDVVKLYIKVTEEFKATHPRFAGTKFIYAPMRFADNDTMDQYLSTAKQLHKQYSQYVVGFDLVGQEDTGRPLRDLADKLLTLPADINFVFHAGETNWHGMTPDENLVDAILLGAKRIGHGYALTKHPLLQETARQRQICVEINPISNQVLKLVADYRNHPASALFASDFPLVVSSDDPSFWRASPLSHDFYIAFMGIASAHQDLRLLKKLALNSLEYSLMSESEKDKAKQLFDQSWNDWITETAEILAAKKRT